ncbi:hypothetical protein I302_103418 [Kwoniella bestiolae CBS 10118]|uniref:Uncharacterized protein n=1 Tax=Kwoniella bestiolae CBS 10118 TaxID=1296100 RepID=A0A1B9G8C2_9TREE|nr:hypothetical protein I302_02118 [Kwoniella bestiolae CBS 10118]OCF27277.1 hypothetical protein I302_02118 [Kwoniella bestiolae CBS 10118]
MSSNTNNRRPDETPPTLPYAYLHGGDRYSPIYMDETPNHLNRPRTSYPPPPPPSGPKQRYRPSQFYQHSILKAGKMGSLPPTISTNSQRPPSPSPTLPPTSLTPTSSAEVENILTSPTFSSREQKKSSTGSTSNSSTPPPPSGSKTFLEMIQEKVDGCEKTIRALTSQLEESQEQIEKQKTSPDSQVEDLNRVHRDELADLKDDLLTQLKGVEDKLKLEEDKVRVLEENMAAEGGKLKAALVSLENMRKERKRLVEEKQSEVVFSEEMKVRLQEMAKEKAEFTHRALQAEGTVVKMNGLMEDSKARESQLNVRSVDLDAEMIELRTKMEEEVKKDKSVLKHLQQVSSTTKEKESLEAEVVSLVARVGEAKERESKSWNELGAANKAKSGLEKKVGIERSRADKAMSDVEKVIKKSIEHREANDKSRQKLEEQVRELEVRKDVLLKEQEERESVLALNQAEKIRIAEVCEVEKTRTRQVEEEKTQLSNELDAVKRSLESAQINLQTSKAGQQEQEKLIEDLNRKVKELQNDSIQANEKLQQVINNKSTKENSSFEREIKLTKENIELKNQVQSLTLKIKEGICLPTSPHHLHLEGDSTLPIPSIDTRSNSPPSSPLTSTPPSPAPVPPPPNALLVATSNSTLEPSSSTDDQGTKIIGVGKAEFDLMQEELRAAKLEIENLNKENKALSTARETHNGGVSGSSACDTPKGSTRVANPFGEYNFVSEMWSKEVREEPDWAKRHELQLRELLAVRAAKKDKALLNLLKRGMGEEEDDETSDQEKVQRPPQKKRIFL